MTSRIQKIVIGTRGSALALWQAKHIRSLLSKQVPGIEIELKVIKTTGDKIQNIALPKIGDKGLFTKEIEQELLDGGIQLAVHSLKDLPTILPDNLFYAGSPKRADVRDAFVSLKWERLTDVPDNGMIATGSLRRIALILGRNPDIRFTDLRGNIDTRIRKLEEQEYDGIIMAAAALLRLDREELITEYLDPEFFVPAVGQGSIGLEINENNGEIQELINQISDSETVSCCRAERAFMRKLEGGCSIPLGAWANKTVQGQIKIKGFVASVNGKEVIRKSMEGDATDPEKLGNQLAERFISLGAKEILGHEHR